MGRSIFLIGEATMRNFHKILLFTLLALIFAETTNAQPKTDLGRDFWFCIPQNYAPTLDPTRYFYLYITPATNTSVYIQIGNSPVLTRSGTANKTITLSSLPPGNEISKSAELQNSGVIENKAIHVWSDDADLSVSFLSKAPFTSDGMYCIPTIGWGKEYIVASYNAFIIDPKIADLPSEFTIVAKEDNTQATITPSADIRLDGSPSVVAHPKDTTFTITLNKGECVQYQTATPPSDQTDLSGTHISSDKLIGVEGASVCPNIPVGDPSCDHILEMLIPTRAWGKRYFTAPFAGRKFGGDGFLIVGTEPGQIINRNGLHAAALGTKFDYAYIYDVTGVSDWTSNAPFMLVQYVLSSTHLAPSTSNRNQGDPAMLAINPTEQFTSELLFTIPTQILASGQASFTNYLTVVSPRAHRELLFLDGQKVGAWTGTISSTISIIDSTWEVIRATFKTNQGEGAHTLTSDTVIGAYIYGFSTDDSYAMSCGLGTKTINGLEASVREHLPLNFGFSAEAITPNPVNKNSVLIARYSLQSQAPLRLELFDQLGNSVAILLSTDLHPEGTFEKQITVPSDLATGTYYYRYICGSTHISGKLVIVK